MTIHFASEVWAGTPHEPKHQLWTDNEVGKKELIYENPDLIMKKLDEDKSPKAVKALVIH